MFFGRVPNGASPRTMCNICLTAVMDQVRSIEQRLGELTEITEAKPEVAA
jgi:hypothetical protein